MDLRTTGISGLDAQLGGGVPPGSTLLLIGDPGNAISIFSEQFSGGGRDQGENVLFYEFDRPAGRLREAIEAYVGPGRARNAELRVHDGYSTQFGSGVISRADPGVTPIHGKDAMNSILQAVQALPQDKPYRLVVESLSSLTTRDNHEEVIEFVKRLVYLGHELGGVHVVSIVKGLHDPVFETHLKHLASGVLEMGTERKGFGIYSYLLVSKMMNLADPVRLVLFKETERGLWLESTKRVF